MSNANFIIRVFIDETNAETSKALLECLSFYSIEDYIDDTHDGREWVDICVRSQTDKPLDEALNEFQQIQGVSRVMGIECNGFYPIYTFAFSEEGWSEESQAAAVEEFLFTSHDELVASDPFKQG